MKQKPSLQFYQQDFLGSMDVQTMSAEQVGCYCLLIFNCYNNDGILPSDPKELSMLCRGIAPASKVLNKFYEKEGCLRHKRIDEELEKREKFSKEMRKAAKKRWNRSESDTMPRQSQSKAKAMRKVCSSSSSSSSNKTSNKLDVSAKAEFGNPEINKILEGLKTAIGIDDFKESQMWQRRYANHFLSLLKKMDKKEFRRRLTGILEIGRASCRERV